LYHYINYSRLPILVTGSVTQMTGSVTQSQITYSLTVPISIG